MSPGLYTSYMDGVIYHSSIRFLYYALGTYNITYWVFLGLSLQK